MIKPISAVNPTSRGGYGCNNLTKQMRAERLQNLIKEFEEQAKTMPKNEALKTHIENLKKSLKELLTK